MSGAGGVGSRKQLDVMAQQLKYIACLKIMMSELATLGTSGCSAGGGAESGGQLRQELHLWLEKQVHALREMCGYGRKMTGQTGDNNAGYRSD